MKTFKEYLKSKEKEEKQEVPPVSIETIFGSHHNKPNSLHVCHAKVISHTPDKIE